jgi:hypothetical protein
MAATRIFTARKISMGGFRSMIDLLLVLLGGGLSFAGSAYGTWRAKHDASSQWQRDKKAQALEQFYTLSRQAAAELVPGEPSPGLDVVLNQKISDALDMVHLYAPNLWERARDAAMWIAMVGEIMSCTPRPSLEIQTENCFWLSDHLRAFEDAIRDDLGLAPTKPPVEEQLSLEDFSDKTLRRYANGRVYTRAHDANGRAYVKSHELSPPKYPPQTPGELGP